MAASAAHMGAMGLADLRLTLDWAAAEGWNPGRHDAVPFLVADPAGFLACRPAGDALPASSISVVRYSDRLGFLGLYITRPERRGRGFGTAVWREGMRHLAGCTVGLDGVVAQQDSYRRSGFDLAHRNIRFEGEPPRSAPAIPLVELASVPFDQVATYDLPCFGAARPAFLAAWIGMPDVVSLAALADGRMTGYGVARPCRRGWKIGPLFADTPDAAEALFVGLGAAVGAGPIILDLPEPNRAAVALAERHGLRPAFETARMYAGPAPEIDIQRVFGITTFELG